MTNKIELLAPAGSMEAMIAAIDNGANAIYLGGKLLNARKYASNFDENEMVEAIRYAHLQGVKTFVTLNILVSDYEMEDAIDYVRFLYDSDVDAVIVQDVGLANVISKTFPDLEIHGSTQMTINNAYGASYLEGNGFTRVILSRETPIEEIKKIKDRTSIELEAFVHGALCFAYSGQCLMSSFIGGRSGNRGTCAQPCRMQYNIMDEKGNLLENIDKMHYLSPKDLNTIDNLDHLINAGITSLKIEGRMKRKEYVATVVKNYRKALDIGALSINDRDREDLTQAFNRGFTKGVGLGDFGRDFMSIDRPDNRGILAGNIVDTDRKNIFVKLVRDMYKGDGIEFQLSNGKYKGLQLPKNAKAGSVISLFRRGNVDMGSKVYRTSSTKLIDEVNKETDEIKEAISIVVMIKQNENPRLRLKYRDYEVEVEGDARVEESKNIPLTEEKVREQLDRLGNTRYYLDEIKIDLDNNSFMTHKDLNKLRRKALDNLENQITNFNNRRSISDGEYKLIKDKYLTLNSFERDENVKLSIKIENIKQLIKLDLNKLDRIYLPINEETSTMIDNLRDYSLEVYLWTDKILYDGDFENYKCIIDANVNRIDGITASNLGTYQFVRKNYDKKIHGEIGLNIFNSYSANYFLSELESVSLSAELNLDQIDLIHKNVGGNLEALVYGYMPVMISRNCPFATIKNCKDDDKCSTCRYANGYGLLDRKGMNFKTYRNGHNSVIYNSVPLMILDKLDEVRKSGINMFRIDFTDEFENIDLLQSMYYDYLNGDIDYYAVKNFVDRYKENTDITMGHFYRGII